MRRRSPLAIGLALVAVLIAGCGGGSRAAPRAPSTQPSAIAATAAPAVAATSATSLALSATSSASAPVEVQVASCTVPAADYAGTPYKPQPVPGTIGLPASLRPPANGEIFGNRFMPGPASYLLGPKSGTCQGGLASADGGMSMTATSVSNRVQSVTMTISPGGVGPSTDLACPYIPAVRAAAEAFPQGNGLCGHPRADVIRQIPTATASLYAAAVLVPAHVKDPNILGPGGGVTGPAVALYTARAGRDAAAGQMIACTLPPAQTDICAASLKFFLATQSEIRTRISAANLAEMEDALASFLAEQGIR